MTAATRVLKNAWALISSRLGEFVVALTAAFLGSLLAFYISLKKEQSEVRWNFEQLVRLMEAECRANRDAIETIEAPQDKKIIGELSGLGAYEKRYPILPGLPILATATSSYAPAIAREASEEEVFSLIRATQLLTTAFSTYNGVALRWNLTASSISDDDEIRRQFLPQIIRLEGELLEARMEFSLRLAEACGIVRQIRNQID